MGQVSSNFNLLTLEYAHTCFFVDFVLPPFALYYSEHMDLLKKQCVRNVEQCHRDQFVSCSSVRWATISFSFYCF